jgi:hypothetical protein
VVIDNFQDKETAMQIITAAITLYIEKFGK